MNNEIDIVINIKCNISFWDAIKMRICGASKYVEQMKKIKK